MTDFGDAVTLAARPLDDDGNPVDVDDLVLRVTLPDGTESAELTPANGGLGSYSYTYTPTLAGRHVAAWSGDDYAWSDVFNVWPADPKFLFSLDDAKRALRRPVAPSTDDEQMRLYIAATTEVIEDIVGPLTSSSITKTFPAGDSALLLEALDVSITSVTINDEAAVEGTDYTVSTDAGIIYAGTSWASGSTRFRYPVTVTYSVGNGAVPPNIILAALEEFRFLWQIGQQGSRPAFGNEMQAEDWTPSGFAVPRRVIELCGSRRKAYTPA